jgi:hypothetical protein
MALSAKGAKYSATKVLSVITISPPSALSCLTGPVLERCSGFHISRPRRFLTQVFGGETSATLNRRRSVIVLLSPLV